MAIFFLLLFFCIFGYEIYRYNTRKKREFDFLFFANIWFTFFYVLVPLYYFIDPLAFSQSSGLYYVLAVEPIINLSVIMVIAASWFSMVLGYHLKPFVKVKYRVDSVTPEKQYRIAGLLMFWSIIFLGACVFIYGPEFLIKNIRFAQINPSQIGFLFLSLSKVGVLGALIYILVFLNDRRFSARKTIFLLFSFLLLLFISIQGGSRGAMILPFLIFYFVICRYENRLILNRYLVLALIATLFFLLFGRMGFAYAIQYGSEINLFNFIKSSFENGSIKIIRDLFANFSYPYISLYNAIEAIEANFIELRWFKDIPLGIIFYLRMIGIETDFTITYYNTQVLTGRMISHVPPGLLGLGIYSMGITGAVLVSFVFGLTLKNLDRFFRTYGTSIAALVIYFMSGILISGFLGNGDLRVWIIKILPIAFAAFFFKTLKNKVAGTVLRIKNH